MVSVSKGKANKIRHCCIDGCGRPHVSRGLCSVHAWRRKHGKDLLVPIRGYPPGAVCVYLGCGAQANSRGACATHHVLLRRHHISADEYAAMLERQNGRCAICCRPGQCLDIDHDHGCCPGANSCGVCIRGLLCRACNKRMSIIDNIWWTERAEEYKWNYFQTVANRFGK